MEKPKPLDLSRFKSIKNLGSDELLNEKLGQYLIRKGLITEEILAYAISIQEKSNHPLGEILQHEGFIPKEIFQEYSINRLFNPNRSESLAALLVKLGKISNEKKEELMLQHRQSGRSLGSILIDEGLISPGDFTQDKIIEILKISKGNAFGTE